jgi:hypothetical protein
LIVCTVWFTLSASARATAPSGPMLLKRKLEEIQDQVSGGACRYGQRTTVHRVSTPTLCTLRRARGAHGARVAHSLDRVHRLVHLERLGKSNSSFVPDVVVTSQAGGIQRSSKRWCMQRWAEDNGTPCQHTNTLHPAQGDGSGQSKGGALTRYCAPSGSP